MSGFGMDYVWCRLSDDPLYKAAIFDRIAVRHTRPIGKALRGQMAKNSIVPEDEERVLRARYDVQNHIRPLIYAALDEGGRLRQGCARLGLAMAIGYLKVYRQFTVQESASWKIMQLIRRQVTRKPDLTRLRPTNGQSSKIINIIDERPPAAVDPKAIARKILDRENGRTAERAKRGIEFAAIVMAFDENYAPHAAACMLSAILNAARGDFLHFFILADSALATVTRRRIEQVCMRAGAPITFLDVDPRAFDGLPLNRGHVSRATYYRLAIPEMIPTEIKRVIYLDADAIVVDDLAALWEADMQGAALAACPDEGGAMQSARLNLPSTHRYFNAGLLLLDLEKLRAMDFKGGAIKTYARNAADIELQDQDILNLMFCNETAYLPLRFNANSSLFVFNRLAPSYSDAEALAAAADPAILHFTDAKKPWRANCAHPLRHIYWRFRNQTPWRENFASKIARLARYRLRSWLSPTERKVLHFHRQTK